MSKIRLVLEFDDGELPKHINYMSWNEVAELAILNKIKDASYIIDFPEKEHFEERGDI